MRKNKIIITKLYFIFSFLVLTAVCVVVYTSIGAGEEKDERPADWLHEQTQMTDHTEDELQQVNSSPYPEASGQSGLSTQETANAQTPSSDEMTYKLVVTDGWLQVYSVQTGTLFMETGIVYDLLPARVQKQIVEGKYFESEEVLLEFLENYSS